MKYLKKIIAAASVVLFSSAFTSQTAAGLSDSEINEVKAIISVLHGAKESSASSDFNNDSKVDILDLIELKHSILENASATGEIKTSEYPASESNVKLVGRTVMKDDTAWLVQSGAAAEFTVTGTFAEVILAGDGCVKSEDRWKPRYAVFVDDELVDDSLLSETQKCIKLFDSKVLRTAKVRVIHLSEANNGAIGISGIKVTSNVAVPVKPEPKKDISIEIIGDSITCGYGVEAASNGDQFSTSTENFMKSYAYLAAQKLNADYSAVSYSGYGVVSGYTSDEKNTDSLVPDYYDYAGRLDDYKVPWDFDKNKNDVVVINLGTNDYSYLSKDLEGRSEDFNKAYYDFLGQVREKNPDSYIICTVGTMGGYEVYDLIEKVCEEYSNDNNDTRISSYRSTTQNAANGYGADWHPSVITQQMSAYVLADKICQVLGIQSDKVGLDAVDGANYDVKINKDNGANAASYVGYDNSLWLNTVTGGTDTSDVQAYISGLDLNPGGTYRLSFDYTTNPDIEVPVQIIADHDDNKVYFSDTVSSTNQKQHYSKEIVLDANDPACALTLGIGGHDYCNLTLSNVSLIKLY
ncbi:MAG: GDSL-type esterase/lipase family protein [Oscillospiraceae bacterium]|nr:GDSL-type esterase/lipase family protein [Oscillospiraceae bacterium]